MVTYVLLRILAVVLLVAANAFFVAAEFALVSLRDTRVLQLIEAGRIGARTVQRLHQNLDEVLLAVQFGVTIAALGLGWIGEPTLAHIFEVWLGHVPHATLWAHATAVTIAFAAITYFDVILGEILPKSIALNRAERTALAVAAPMEFFITISRPVLALMKSSSRAVLHVFGLRQMREGHMHSPDELKLMVTASRRVGLLPQIQEDMIHRVLELANVEVREIMVPRPQIFSLSADMPLDEAMGRVVEMQHSRVPVYDPQRGVEHIIGVLYSKDVSRLMHIRLTRAQPASATTLRIRHLMREALFVPESKTVADLLIDFKQRRRHLAVVVDEFGSTAGVVTVEDALEQIVGEIEDEFDIAEQPPLSTGAVMVLDASENIRDLETQFHLPLPRDEGFETLGGFVFSRLQRIPNVGDAFVFEGRRYTVLQMDGRRVGRVKIELQPVTAPPAPAAD
jgi:magnesium and cobalt exporter, CNNM family